jgi:hypothetical protein
VEALCLVLTEEVVEVLAVGVEVAILAVMVGLSSRTGFVLFSVGLSVFVASSFRHGAWCRLEPRSRNLIQSFVGRSCRDFFS